MYNPYQMYQQPQPPQIISVRSENDARNYPIAPGNSVTFKDENAPYIYIKTMGLSQFDSPTFERFRLVKEDGESTQEGASKSTYDNSVIDEIKSDISGILDEIESIKKKLKTPVRKKEVDDEQ